MAQAATITKTQSAQPAGEYQPTGIDAARTTADILIVGYAKNDRTAIHTTKKLSGAGIKLERLVDGVGRYLVTDEVMTELRRRFTVATDF